MASAAFVLFVAISHMFVSSTMLILNKAVLAHLPVATTVLVLQVGFSAIIVWLLGKLGTIQVSPFEASKAKTFFWNAVAFMILLFSNAKALQAANVEAVIVFRTLSLFVTAYGDFRLLKTRILSFHMVGTLCLVLVGALGYVISDKGLEVHNFFWVLFYGCANAAYPLVTQVAIRSHKQMSSWDRAFYNNLMTLIVFLPGIFLLDEHKAIQQLSARGQVTTFSLLLLLLSCVWGTAISFLGFLCLENLTATTFNVMGNANKLLTLVLNSLIWDQHASLQANVFLLTSLIGSAMYGEVRRRECSSKSQRQST
uniref:Sugar phosphate transporter domain-containing protein n=1 Tax=Hanusia phi TaxID=3032 RepID=A0A7S0EIW6_9CRYP|mmetsp:Transcript_24435/g.55079  ORF Transcript_24435/g.55079 Transcript_24435/m.55079 type:complete len:311 (+) Transcript_24435:159-1091(+)